MSSSSFITNSSHRHLFAHYSCLAAEHHKLSSSLPDIVKDIAFKHSSNCRCSLQRSSSPSLSSLSPPPSLPAIASSDQELLLEVGQSLMRISESFQQTRNSQKIFVIIDVKLAAFSFSVKMSFSLPCLLACKRFISLRLWNGGNNNVINTRENLNKKSQTSSTSPDAEQLVDSPD